MLPVGTNVWSKVPGYDAGDSDSEEFDSEEEEFIAAAEERLQAVRRSLGHRYVETSCIEFAAVQINEKGPPRQLKEDPPPPKHHWMNKDPPAFRIERVHAPIVSRTFLGNGLTPTNGKDWLVQWSGPGMRDFAYQGLHEYQRVNHFPGSTELTRKDRLWEHFREMKQAFGGDSFDFVPDSYVLPDQVEEFLNCYERTKHIWIVKPNASSQGKGIFLLRDLEDLPLTECSVVSRYVDNPLLIQGLKFDLRIYVLVTSYSPLRAYVYREGLTRFASSPYSVEDEHLRDAYRHLTNYSVNKSAHNFIENQELEADNYGHKWSLSALNKHLQCVGIDSDLMWSRIMDLIVKTLLSVEPSIASKTREITLHPANCFEVYGFDVLVDDRLKPWLLEVNLSPSMKADSPLDWKVKSSLLSDAFNLVGIPNPDRQTVASSRLRSRVLQCRKSYTDPRQASGPISIFRNSFSAGEAPRMLHSSNLHAESERKMPLPPRGAFSERPVALDKLSEEQLKMLAQSMREVRKCSNFIRLHPTRTTVERYLPLTDPRGPRGSEFPEQFRIRQSALSRLLSSVLFGPPPQLFGMAVAKQRPRRDISESKRDAASPRRSTESTHSGGDAESTASSELEESEAESMSENGRPDSAQSEKIEEPERVERVLPVFNPSMALAAMQVLLGLGNRACFRLVLMEYLIRVSNTCNKLGVEERASLAQSSAFSRLSKYREELLETIGKLVRKPAHVVQRELDLGEGSGLVESLATACHASLCCLARDAWATETQMDIPPNLNSPRLGMGSLTLASHLLPAFAQGALGQQALATLPSLGAADLEWIMLDPQCPSELRHLLESFAPEGHQTRQRFHNGSLNSTFERRHVQPYGPLSELLTVSSARPPSAPRPMSDPPESPTPVGTRVERQFIFPRMEPPPRPPALQYRSRSTPILPRLVPESFSPIPAKRPWVGHQSPADRSPIPGPMSSFKSRQGSKPSQNNWNFEIEL